jgi:CRP/FNR family cyclic AMP-dependent transcriptional regulator
VKKLIDRFLGGSPASAPGTTPDDSGYFATMFMERPEPSSPIAASAARSRLVSAEAVDHELALNLLLRAWGHDRYMARLDERERARLAEYLEFVVVPTGREVIAQDEPGDFAVIVLDGLLAVDRIHPWGGRARLSEAREGDVLGELSLLDAGARFSACTTLSRSTLAIVGMQQLDAMMRNDPRLGMALMASMARRLSLRMRQVSARLSALLSAT